MLVEVSGDRSPVLSEPKLLFERRYSYGTAVTLPDYDVDTDGQRLLVVKEDPGRDRINVISNFLEEVKQRMGGR
jgi:hypothetical protein